jgi:hypothetical protein
VVISAASSRTLRFIDRLHSSHFNSCVVGLVRGRCGVPGQTPPLLILGGYAGGSVSQEKGDSPPMQKSIEQINVRQIVKQLVVELVRHLDASEAPAEPRSRFPSRLSRHAMYRLAADR